MGTGQKQTANGQDIVAQNGDMPAPTELVPVTEYNDFSDVRRLYTKNQVAWKADPYDMFPSLGQGRMLWSKDVEGVPFLFTSGVEIVNLPERKMGDGTRYAAQECVRVQIQPIDIDAQEILAVVLLNATDRYLVNQLRGAREDDLVGSGVWTIGRNDQFSTPSGPPRMLKRWEYGKDKRAVVVQEDLGTSIVDSVFTEQTRSALAQVNDIMERSERQQKTVDKNTAKIQGRINEIEAARASRVEQTPWEDKSEDFWDGVEEIGNTPQPVKRGRGRPRKNP